MVRAVLASVLALVAAFSAPRAAAETCVGAGAAISAVSVPFANGRRAESVAAVAPGLAFHPVVPTGFGRPFRVYVRGTDDETRFAALALVYREAPGDWFRIVESAATTPRAAFDESVGDVARRDPCGVAADTIRLLDGSLALLAVGPNRRAVSFRRGTVELVVLGPVATFSRPEALALANRLLLRR